MMMKKQLQWELRGDSEIVFTRHFSAPRELVYDCHTKPELVERWLTGPEGWRFSTCQIDLRVGGRYLYVWQNPKSAGFGMVGFFREIKAPERIQSTEDFVPDISVPIDATAPTANASINTLELKAEGAQTLMTLTCKFASAEICKMAVESGMARGMGISYQRLDKICEEKNDLAVLEAAAEG